MAARDSEALHHSHGNLERILIVTQAHKKTVRNEARRKPVLLHNVAGLVFD
jgi:hypothetical protein